VVVRAKAKRILRYGIAAVVVGTALWTFGCVSTSVAPGTTNIGFKTQQTKEPPKRVLSKQDFEHIINDKLSRQETVRYLRNISIEDYNIQDPNTNWSHASIGGAESKYSVYYLTYHHRYFIFLLADIEDRYLDCVDAITGPMPSTSYEIGMGPVEVNRDHLDGSVIVVFNKKWKGNYSDDIIAAFRPNLDSRQLETFDYTYIRIFREE
jgi:hypothetical protein